MVCLFFLLDCYVFQTAPKLRDSKMESSMWHTVTCFWSQNLSFVKVCVYVLYESSKKASARLAMQPMRARREAILTHSLESKLNASWYFSLHASPFVSFNYSLVVNKLLSCWCFINHSDCYDNMFVYSFLLQSWDSCQSEQWSGELNQPQRHI